MINTNYSTNNIYFYGKNKEHKHNKKLINALLITSMVATPLNDAVANNNDTFQREAERTEYVAPVKQNNSKGEQFLTWVWNMIACSNEDGSLDKNYMKQKNYNQYFDMGKTSSKELAKEIVGCFDEDGDSKINYNEFVNKGYKGLVKETGRTYTGKEIEDWKDGLFTPLFGALDINNTSTQTLNCKNDLDQKEIEANIETLRIQSNYTSGNTKLNGVKLLNEINTSIESNRPTTNFLIGRSNVYEEIK